MQQPIGAGLWHPIGDVLQSVGAQDHAFGNDPLAVCIIGTTAGRIIKQAAGYTRENQFARIDIFKLVQTTFSTPITQTFPFLWGHLVERNGFPISGAYGHERHISLLYAKGKRELARGAMELAIDLLRLTLSLR